MKTKWAFLPCAGFGTRMGAVGKKVPKPLFSFYEKTLLDHQVSFCRELGFENFIINTHHCFEKMNQWVNQFQGNLVALHEKEILGNGGAFHNIKKNHPEIEDVYVFNPDSLLLTDESFWIDLISSSKSHKHLLATVPCDREDQYNRLVLNEYGELLEIIPPSMEAPCITYAGFGRVNLSEIEFVSGPSSFFETVVRPGRDNIGTVQIESSGDFWDFGTLAHFQSRVLEISKNRDSSLFKFLKRTKGLNQDLLQDRGYASDAKDVYDFRLKNEGAQTPGIYFSCFGEDFSLPLNRS